MEGFFRESYKAPAIFGNALITNVLHKQPLGEAFPCCAVMDNIRPFMNTVAGEALRVTGWFPGGNDHIKRGHCNPGGQCHLCVV
jgi:hypothetical protein